MITPIRPRAPIQGSCALVSFTAWSIWQLLAANVSHSTPNLLPQVSRPSMPSTQRAPSSRPVLIAGAGPVGLAVALNLVRRGIPITILEAGDRIADDPRAGTIHPPTLELFATVGMTDAMLARGYVVRNYQYRDRRSGVVADFDLSVLADDTTYPFRLMLEQHKICGMLIERLKQHPECELLMQHRVTEATQHGDEVTATVETPAGEKTFGADWMIGCDGAPTPVPNSLPVDFLAFP